jgi:hypothetical protein
MKNTHVHRADGTAMAEMILVLPLLMIVLALLLYFGRGVVRTQHAQVMDRYEAWRQARGAPGPRADSAAGNEQLNQTFFGSNAAGIEYEGSDAFPSRATDQLIQAAAARNVPAEYRLSQLIDATIGYNDRGRTVRMTTSHADRARIWQRYNQPTRHQHTRIGNDWAHVNGWTAASTPAGWRRSGPFGPNVLPPIRDIYWPDFDAELNNTANPLAEAIRGLYLGAEGYAGPAVTP